MMKNRILLILKIAVVVLVAVIGVANFLPGHKVVEHDFKDLPSIEDPQVRRALSFLLGPPIIDGNKVEAFYNGAEIFPAMLKAISSAEKTITFEAYIYWSDNIGKQFIEALCERARHQVKVHVLVDWMGSRQLKPEYMDQLKEAGVELEMYKAPNIWNLTQMNNRTHRRILVIDGKIGFTGGVGICEDWDGNGDQPERWRDTQYRIEGPAVAYLQNAFMDNWLKLHPDVLYQENYFPELKAVGNSWAQVFKSSTNAGSESIALMFQMAIASARKSIYLSTAYFLPNEKYRAELIKARERGVQIYIIVPGPNIDTKIVQHASRKEWGELLKAGIEIYEFQPARYHNKALIIDETFVSVGSTNFDNRSFSLNDEANLNIWDSEFAKTLIQAFERDRAKSRQVTLEEWNNRPQSEKVIEVLANLLGTQL
jgi:cardiolipin synthase